MAIKITEAIPQQNFELLLQFIGAQLLIELDNQKALQAFTENQKVFLERATSVDVREREVTIIVLFDSITLDSKNPSDQMYIGTYFIDIYANGKASVGKSGGENTGLLLLKYLGLCRYILESQKVKEEIAPELRLNFSVNSVNVFEVNSNQDTGFSRMGRISLEVKLFESQEIFSGVPFSENHTNIKLQDTEDGYQLILK